MPEVKPKTVAELKAELLSEVRGELQKLDSRLKKTEAGYSELKAFFADIKAMHQRGDHGLTDDGKHRQWYK